MPSPDWNIYWHSIHVTLKKWTMSLTRYGDEYLYIYIWMVLNYNWTRILLRSSFAKSLQSLSGITSHNWWQFTQVHKSELEMQWIAQDYWRYTVTTHSRSALPLVCIVEVRRFRTRYNLHKHIQNWSLENREEVGRGSKHHSKCADSAWPKLCAGTLEEKTMNPAFISAILHSKDCSEKTHQDNKSSSNRPYA